VTFRLTKSWQSERQVPTQSGSYGLVIMKKFSKIN
jgi:hypothetical protein